MEGNSGFNYRARAPRNVEGQNSQGQKWVVRSGTSESRLEVFFDPGIRGVKICNV